MYTNSNFYMFSFAGSEDLSISPQQKWAVGFMWNWIVGDFCNQSCSKLSDFWVFNLGLVQFKLVQIWTTYIELNELLAPIWTAVHLRDCLVFLLVLGFFSHLLVLHKCMPFVLFYPLQACGIDWSWSLWADIYNGWSISSSVLLSSAINHAMFVARFFLQLDVCWTIISIAELWIYLVLIWKFASLFRFILSAFVLNYL